MAAFKNVDTDYYIIDCTEIKRKEIKTSNRRPEPGCENHNDIEVVDTKKPQDFSNHCLGAFCYRQPVPRKYYQCTWQNSS